MTNNELAKSSAAKDANPMSKCRVCYIDISLLLFSDLLKRNICYDCISFYDSYREKKFESCIHNGTCKIDSIDNRNDCTFCRFQKCIGICFAYEF